MQLTHKYEEWKYTEKSESRIYPEFSQIQKSQQFIWKYFFLSEQQHLVGDV